MLQSYALLLRGGLVLGQAPSRARRLFERLVACSTSLPTYIPHRPLIPDTLSPRAAQVAQSQDLALVHAWARCLSAQGSRLATHSTLNMPVSSGQGASDGARGGSVGGGFRLSHVSWEGGRTQHRLRPNFAYPPCSPPQFAAALPPSRVSLI